jgi:hypothetical protein
MQQLPVDSNTVRPFLPRSNIVKKIIRVLAVVVFLLSVSTAPSFADGNPLPICNASGCHSPL